MKIAMIAMALVAVTPVLPTSFPDRADGSTRIVVTATPSPGTPLPVALGADDVAVTLGNARAHVLQSRPLARDLADMQLFVLVDDSLRSSGLGVHLPDLKKFVAALPPTTQVAIGYMRNGTFGLVQGFTADHQKAADSLRLPQAVPGGNGSPYFALADLARHWPSNQPVGRRAVLMLTDGVDRYWDNSVEDDPYVDQAVEDALKQGIIVYSIYIRDAGFYDRRDWPTLFAQSRLNQVSEQTGGRAYFENFTDPVSIQPFLNDFESRLGRQYEITIAAAKKGEQRLQVRSELRGVKIEGPTRVYMP